MRAILTALSDPRRRPALLLAVALATAYTLLNLHASWEPTARLAYIRAGIVNEDEPVGSGSERVAVGEDLTRTLLEEGPFGWREMTLTEAEEALAAGRLDFFVHIPPDASRKIVSLPMAEEPERPILRVYVDPAYNYPMKSIADTLIATLRQELNGKVTATYLERLLNGVDSAIAGIARAADGARQVADGAAAARDGAGELADGLKQAAAGGEELQDGIVRVDAGAAEVADGAAAVRDGNRELAAGLVGAAEGAEAVAAGTTAVREGSTQLVNGYAQLAEGGERLTGGIGAAVDGVRQIKQGVQDSLGQEDPVLTEAVARIEFAMKSLAVRYPYLLIDPHYHLLKDSLQRMSARADELQQESVAQLAGALTQLEQGLQQAQDGSRQLTQGAWTGYNRGQELIAGTRELEAGAYALSDGIATAADGARRLADGSARLAAGSRELADGTARLKEGGEALAGGLTQLRDGGQRLVEGLTALHDGADQLADGLEGATTAGGIPQPENAGPMSRPVEVTDEKLHPVPKPGEALLALVVPMALWVGTLVLVMAGPHFRSTEAAEGNGGAPTGQTPVARLRAQWPAVLLLTLAVAGVSLLLGPRVAHPVLFLLVAGLTAATFLAINQALGRRLGVWGYAVSGLLLILMPVAVGSQAPYILLPGPYRWAAAVLPLTHALRGLQATVAGGAWSIFWLSVAALLLFLGLALWLDGRARESGGGSVAQVQAG